MSLMYSDNGDPHTPTQTPTVLPEVPGQELAPGEAVSVRASEPGISPLITPAPITSTPIPSQQPAGVATQPLPAVTAQVPTYSDATSSATPQFDVAPSRGFYAQDDTSDHSHAATDTSKISWTATEFIAHPKSTSWYLAFIGITVVITLLAFLVTKDLVTVIVLIICAGLFGYTAGRQPRQLQYWLGGNGIQIGQKFYPYKEFKSFSVLAEGGLSSIDFMPLKRFAPMLNIYFDPIREPQVVDVLSEHLPASYHKRSFIDELMHRIHF